MSLIHGSSVKLLKFIIQKKHLNHNNSVTYKLALYTKEFLLRKLLTVSKQCWRMVRALRSHGRCYLVVFFWWDVAVRHSYSNFLCDWPSVDHCLVNRAVRPERSSCLLSNVHLRGVVGNKLAGPLIRPSPSTIASLHDITGNIYFLL